MCERLYIAAMLVTHLWPHTVDKFVYVRVSSFCVSVHFFRCDSLLLPFLPRDAMQSRPMLSCGVSK